MRLTVDHVIPSALGGSDDPNNLVTACQPCNAGKSSIAPDQAMVEDVDATALLFGRAMERVAEDRRADQALLDEQTDYFGARWQEWFWTCDRPDCREKHLMPIDHNWRESIERFLAAGLEDEDLQRFTRIAMAANVSNDRRWRYFCGCCWHEITDRQEAARRLIEDGEV